MTFEAGNLKLETGNWKLEIRNWKLEIGNWKLETGNSKLETGSSAVVEEMQSSIDNRQSSIAVEEQPSITEKSQSSIINRQSPMTLPLLLEVGCEEIPARFLRSAEKALGERVQAALVEARLLPEEDLRTVPEPPPSMQVDSDGVGALREAPLQTFSTPRRLVVYVPALLAQQPDKVEDILGPPVKVAVDAEGKYTRAAESFAQKNAANLAQLFQVTTPKGEYLALSKTTQGRSAHEILTEILPAAILGLSFPKSMYWREKSAPRFVRPIRWVVAILGAGKQARTVDFEILGVKSGNITFGHRASSRGALKINDFKDYIRKLRQAHVEINPTTRRDRILIEAKGLVETASLQLVEDKELVDWIANSTEWPRPMVGNFDERFLHLPREILITVMRDHQKYFAVEDAGGNLKPHFVGVLNMDSDALGLIRQGHQRVLRARFRDAEFFWNADQRTPLAARLPRLEKVTYQAELGSYGDKIRRMKAIAEHLGARLEAQGIFKAGERQHVLRALELSKCDLTTQMVQEFPELQGVVGGLYAKAQGELEEVATAVYDHYLPLGAEGQSPRSLAGMLVSVVDKLDSVVAGFAVGHDPTGSSDPFALRRQANAIIKVLLENSLPVDLKESVNQALDVLDIEWRRPRPEVSVRVLDFLAERLRYYFESMRGFRYDTVRAVVAAGGEQPTDAQARAEALESLRGGEDLAALSAAAKRIRNILAKSASAADWQPGEVDAALFDAAEEKDLHEKYLAIAAEAGRLRQEHDYRRALEVISTLRPAVDRFFDKVLVMAEDRAIRQNRLRLLKKLDELFTGIAHLAELEGE